MSITLAAIGKNQQLKPGDVVSQYLETLPGVLNKQEREGFIFVNGVGVVGFVFEGKLPKKKREDFLSFTIEIGKAKFTVAKFLLRDDNEALRQLSTRLKKEFRIPSSFVLMEHTGRWDIYKDDWTLAPPRITPKGNIYLPYGMISPYFGGEDKRGVYKEDKRGIKFAEAYESKSIPLIVNEYYGKFLDKGCLEDLVSQEKTGLRHFTMGIAEDKDKPVIFYTKHEKLRSIIGVLETKQLRITCSLKPLIQVIKSRFYPRGKLIFLPLCTPYASVDGVTKS